MGRRVILTVNKIAWTVAGVGLLLKLALLSGGSILLLVGLGAAAIGAALFAFVPADAAPGASATATGGGAGIAVGSASFLLDSVLPKVIYYSSAIAAIGILFCLMSWRGYKLYLLIGGVNLIGLNAALLSLRKEFSYTLLLGAVCAALFFTPQKTLVRLFHRNDPELVRKMEYQLDNPKDTTAATAVRRHLLRRSAAN